VILTTSKAEEDVMRTYNLHANCYVTKPVDLEKFIVVGEVDRRVLADGGDPPEWALKSPPAISCTTSC